MVEKWRPKDWEDVTRKYIGHRGTDFEFGADAMLESLFKLAKESPTGTFTIDSKVINIYKLDKKETCK